MIKDNLRLQKISEMSWLVCKKNDKLGILNKDEQKKYTLVMEKSVIIFNNDKELKQHLGKNIFKQQIKDPISKLDEVYINGFKVKGNVSSVFLVEENDSKYREDLPLYLKSLDSKIYYAAGWYSIDYEKAWKVVQGAKLTTLEKYNYIGPFTAKQSCVDETRELNKKKKENTKKINKLKNKLIKLKSNNVKEYTFDIDFLYEVFELMRDK